MNQILENKKNMLKKKRKYNFQFYLSILFVLGLFVHFLYKKFNEINFSKISEATNKSYSITHLYQNNINSNLITNETKITIIGTIKIPKINLSYPIFSEYSDELLKISVCKFYGPDINSAGNFCIIGHNYNNEAFFSNLYKLNINDTINIYDTNSNIISYDIYRIYEVNSDDLSYLDQDTNR